MKIETERRFTKEEAKEWTSILINATKIMSKPTKKLTNVFSFGVKALIFIIISSIFFGFFLARGDRDVLTIFGIAITGISALVFIIFAVRTWQIYQTFMKRDAEHVILTLDEKGIDYEVVGSKKMQTSWENVSFARVFDQGIYVFPKDITGMIFGMEKKYLEDFKSFLKDHQINLQIVE